MKYRVNYGAENDRHTVEIDGKKEADAFAAERENGDVEAIKPDKTDAATA